MFHLSHHHAATCLASKERVITAENLGIGPNYVQSLDLQYVIIVEVSSVSREIAISPYLLVEFYYD